MTATQIQKNLATRRTTDELAQDARATMLAAEATSQSIEQAISAIDAEIEELEGIGVRPGELRDYSTKGVSYKRWVSGSKREHLAEGRVATYQAQIDRYPRFRALQVAREELMRLL